MALHNHLLLNGSSTKPPQDEALAIEWLRQLVESIGMKIIQGPYASYVTKEGNRGLTAIVMIETSHIALHVWDETDPAFIQFDLYTCSTLPIKKVIDNLVEIFGLTNYRYKVLERSEGFKTVVEESF